VPEVGTSVDHPGLHPGRELLLHLLVVILGRSTVSRLEFACGDLIQMASVHHLHIEYTVAVWMRLCIQGPFASLLCRH
jgi:hypothetical protein